MPERASRFTGITFEMVAGQRIDVEAASRFIEPADLVVAHNARQRPLRADGRPPAFGRKMP